MKGKMSRLILYVLFGATFLPGFLSDQFDPRTEYSIQNAFSNNRQETDGIVAYELQPLLRVKRQTPVNAPSFLPTPTPSTDKKNGLGAIWANLSRKTTGPLSNGGESTSLFRSSANVFTKPSNGTEQGTQVPLESDSLYPNGTNSMDGKEFPEDPADFAKKFNVTNKKEDDYQYYKVQYINASEGMNYWVDVDSATKHEMLSNAHRRAATLKPKFNFTFYGHLITNLTVATGGFIYLGDQVHAWLAATQYVAPLMANFDSTTDNSTVSYLNDEKSFTVEWKEVRLHDSPEKGNFTFQATLYENGTIVFVYKNIPIPVSKINDTQHPVKVGLSDAYIKDRSLLVIKQKTIYEYHRIDLKDKIDYEVTNGSAIIFTLQKTCLSYSSCDECTTDSDRFECGWCPKLSACSNGLDRNRQEWQNNGCDKESVIIKNASDCHTHTYSNLTPTSSRHDELDDSHQNYPDHNQEKYKPETSQVQKSKTEAGGTSAGGMIAIMFFVILAFSGVGWLCYAYFYPHTPSGQFLIRYRPTQWAFRRGEARYTAASSIHM